MPDSRCKQSVFLFALVAAAAVLGWTNQSHAAERDRFLSRVRQISFDGRRAGEGYFSPDGSKMIMQAERHQDNPFFQIYILDLVTGRSHLVSPGVGSTTCSFFRPGTDEVLFSSTHLDPKAREKHRLEYEERPKRATGHTPFVYDEYYDIFSCDQRGRNMRRLTEAVGYDAEAAYSPDGKLIVFCSLRSAYPLEEQSEKEREIWAKQPEYFGELYIMNADGSGKRRLTNDLGYDGGPFFTPDGERVIWRHFEENGYIADIYTIKIDGTDRRRLTDFKAMSWAPWMHRSGEYAIFTSNKLGFANFELFLVDALGEKEPVRVTYTDGFDGLAAFTPDGNQLAWASIRATRELRTGQLFMADWNHLAASAAVRAAPPRGTPEPKPTFERPRTVWPNRRPPKIRAGLKPWVNQEDLYMHVRFLAADALGGRMTGTEGARKAADYIATIFQFAGLEPMGDNGTYYQEFPFPEGIEVVAEETHLGIASSHGSTAHTFELDKDFRPLSFSSNGSVDGGVAFAGYGLVIPEEPGKPKYDSYDGIDVKGKIVVSLDDVPMDLETDERIRFTHYSSPRYKAKLALERGAAGFLLVIGPNTPGAGSLLRLSRTDSDSGIVAASISIATADRLLSGQEAKLEGLQGMLDSGTIPKHFAKLQFTAGVEIKTHLARKQGRSRNVVGFLPPTGDGKIAEEYVVIGAHYDHIGHGEAGGSRAISGEEGQIHNGADDNASGVATVLELAAQIAWARKSSDSTDQQRGIIFAGWGGEEIGVIGSTYFARHAPCPLGQIAAYVNLDMVGRLREGRLILQGVGSSSDWLGLIETVNIREPLALVIQNDPYLPTDTHEFYPAGIPVLSFFTDVHDDYNRPTDDADTLNYAGMVSVALFAEQLVTELATQPNRPAYTSVKKSTPKGGGMGGRRIYTGTIPDFAAGDVVGMKISGVGGGSPAEKAGMTGGDVIVELAGHEINGIEDYSVILRALKPDVAIEIVVERNGERIPLTITPTLRK